MTPKLHEMYKTAVKDKRFCEDMRRAEGCFVTGMFSSELEKISFAGMYCGWLLKDLGVDGYNNFIK